MLEVKLWTDKHGWLYGNAVDALINGDIRTAAQESGVAVGDDESVLFRQNVSDIEDALDSLGISEEDGVELLVNGWPIVVRVDEGIFRELAGNC